MCLYKISRIVFYCRSFSTHTQGAWARVISGDNTLRPEQNGRYFADDILKCIFLHENRIVINVSLKFAPKSAAIGLAQLQEISWTNDDPVHWRIYASPDLNLIRRPMLDMVDSAITVLYYEFIMGHYTRSFGQRSPIYRTLYHSLYHWLYQWVGFTPLFVAGQD